jgi:hypothetical protein
MTNEMAVEKHVSAFNDSFIKKFKQNVFVNHGRGFIKTNNSSTCQIWNSIEHVAMICPKIKDLKPKCGKCGLLHRIKNCSIWCGYCSRMDHIKDRC